MSKSCKQCDLKFKDPNDKRMFCSRPCKYEYHKYYLNNKDEFLDYYTRKKLSGVNACFDDTKKGGELTEKQMLKNTEEMLYGDGTKPAIIKKACEPFNKTSKENKITRLEVIDHTKSVEKGGGNICSLWDTEIAFELQDEGRTLKVFINKER